MIEQRFSHRDGAMLSCAGVVRGCGGYEGMYYNIGLRTWLQLVCCALVLRTGCPNFGSAEGMEVDKVRD